MPAGAVSLSAAIDEIKVEVNARQTEEPFFLMVGAGVSVPVIPLASEIVAECKKRLGEVLNTPPEGVSEYTWYIGFLSQKCNWS
jgi:hypothetical protein